MLHFRRSEIILTPGVAADGRVKLDLAVVKLMLGLGHFFVGGDEDAEKEKFCDMAFAKLPAPAMMPPAALSSCQSRLVGEGFK